MTKKQLLIPVAVVTLAGATFLGLGNAYAQSDTPQQYPPIVQKIADKFGLNAEEVNTVFKEHHAEQKTQMQTKLTQKLDEAVTSGKITEEQKEAILKKMKELRSEKEANMEKFKDMTPEQRQEAMKAEKQELEEWAKANNIDLQSLLPFGGMKFKVHREM